MEKKLTDVDLCDGFLAPERGVVGLDQLGLLEVKKRRLAGGVGDGQHAVAQGQAFLVDDVLQRLLARHETQ